MVDEVLAASWGVVCELVLVLEFTDDAFFDDSVTLWIDWFEDAFLAEITGREELSSKDWIEASDELLFDDSATL